MKKSIGMFLLGATLAFGLAFSAYLVAQAAIKVSKSETIRVKGSASKFVNSDTGCWTGIIHATGVNLTEASRQLSVVEKQAQKLITGIGFADNNIVWDDIQIETVFRRNEKGISTGEVQGYHLSRCLSVTSGEVNRIETLGRHFTNLVKLGYHVENCDISYTIADLDVHKIELLSNATQNGYQRAETLAGSAGGKVGELLSASQGIFQVLAPGEGNISDYGTYDRSTIVKEIKAVVTLEFNVK